MAQNEIWGFPIVVCDDLPDGTAVFGPPLLSKEEENVWLRDPLKCIEVPPPRAFVTNATAPWPQDPDGFAIVFFTHRTDGFRVFWEVAWSGPCDWPIAVSRQFCEEVTPEGGDCAAVLSEWLPWPLRCEGLHPTRPDTIIFLRTDVK